MAYTGFRHHKRLRGDVVSVLNRLVREGVVATYQTNFHGSLPCPDAIEITVTGRPEAGNQIEVQNRVKAELASFSDRAAFHVSVAAEARSGNGFATGT